MDGINSPELQEAAMCRLDLKGTGLEAVAMIQVRHEGLTTGRGEDSYETRGPPVLSSLCLPLSLVLLARLGPSHMMVPGSLPSGR